MSDIRALVAEAIAATRIEPPARYAWFGQLSPRLPARMAQALSAHAAREYLVQLLADRLYSDFYRRGRAEPSRWNMPGPAASRREFEASLSAANCGRGFLDDGWQVRGADERGVIVTKNGLELTVAAAELTGTGGVTGREPARREPAGREPAGREPAGREPAGGEPAGGEPARGEPARGEPPADGRVALRLPKELFEASPGFYLVCGDRPIDGAWSRRVVRLYWNLRADGGAPFVESATRRLNSADAVFRLKVLNDPAAFGRCDAAVVYLARDDYPALADLILGLHAEVSAFLTARTPVFTDELAPGLGFAEDPGTAESFGEHRCRLLADALVRAHEAGLTDVAQTLTAVEERFARDGIDLDAAHLSPGPAANPVPTP